MWLIVCIQNPTQPLAEPYDIAESGYKKLTGWSKRYFFCGFLDMMRQSRSPNSMWAFYKSGSEGKIASGSESDKEEKWKLLVLKNSTAGRQRNTLMRFLTEKWAKVKSKWPFSRELRCLQQDFEKNKKRKKEKKICKRHLEGSGPTREQGAECSCRITKK